jgi:hypothetical protein
VKRSIIFLGLAVAVWLVAPAQSHGSPPTEFDFSFSYSPDTISGSGTLYATPNGDGSYTAVSGSTSVSIADTGTLTTGSADGQSLNVDLTLLTSLSGYPASVSVPGIIGVPPTDSFIYDNLIYPTSTSHFDLDGLLFTDGVSYLNLLNFGGIDLGNGPVFDGYGFFDPTSTDLGNYLYFDPVNFTVSQVPEPSTIVLSLLGGYGVGLCWLRRKRVA